VIVIIGIGRVSGRAHLQQGQLLNVSLNAGKDHRRSLAADILSRRPRLREVLRDCG